MLDGISLSEQEFYQQQERGDHRWGTAFNVALVLHVGFLFGVFFMPNMFQRRPLLDEIMTIDLVSMPEPAAVVEQKTPLRTRTSKSVSRPLPVVQKMSEPKSTVSVAPHKLISEPELEPVQVVKAKPVSIRPLKRKIKKAKDTRLVEEKQRQRQAMLLRRQQRVRKRALAKARDLERQAEEEARRARTALASVIRETQVVSGASSRRAQARSRNSSLSSALEKQYYADLVSRVERLWVLPEIKKWSPTLETIVEFTVLRDGRLLNVQITHGSGDAFFDRFARETVRKSAPMPPIPAVLKKDRLDFGFRLRPAGIQ